MSTLEFRVQSRSCLFEICDSKQWHCVQLFSRYFRLVGAGIANLVERLAMSLTWPSSNTGTERGFLFSTQVHSGSWFCLTFCNMATRTVSLDCGGQCAMLVVHFSASGSGCLIPRKKFESFHFSLLLFQVRIRIIRSVTPCCLS